ncbi:MAG: alcohol dehydrogenase catalytic domain-containing protein [Deltaproteobacteria bacterium]|nr:alcohol dehydrogenase catalytic domain-containing protein [Deltaproteobacteria bacterium]
MRAILLEQFKGKMEVKNVPDPKLSDDNAVIIKIMANGICRSDWHEWMGDWEWVGLFPTLPIIPGHEACGLIEEVGKNVKLFKKGDKVVVPVGLGCCTCPSCQIQNSNNCDTLRIVGFSFNGTFAEYMNFPDADYNLFRLPESLDYVGGAALGCRFQTAYHGVVSRGQVKPGDKVVVYGCGGIGLTAIDVCASMGAYVIAVDIMDDKLELAKKVGAHDVVNARKTNPVQAVKDLTHGGADMSVDALGEAETCLNAILSLRNRGRHVQIGLTTQAEKGNVSLPLDVITAMELSVNGSLTMPKHQYAQMLTHIERGTVSPVKYVTKTVTLDEAPAIIESMTEYKTLGVNVVVF